MKLLQCLNPTSGYRIRGINPKTGRKFGLCNAEKAKSLPPSSLESVAFRCGKCLNCLKYRGSVLMARCVAESRMHDDSAFVTLTVDDCYLPEVFPCGSLVYEPFQKFMKRLRKNSGVDGLKFVMCGEYGELSCRPHYHVIVFGLPAFEYSDTHCRRPDGLGCFKSRTDNHLFSSSWPYGEVFCGSVTPASIAYVTGYTLKQFVLGRDVEWYQQRGLAAEFVKWSRRPGLGRSYFEKFGLMDDHLDGSIDCGVPIDDRRVFPGRYFLEWLRLTASPEYDRLLSSYERGNSIDREGEVIQFSSALAERGRRVDTLVHRSKRSKRM